MYTRIYLMLDVAMFAPYLPIFFNELYFYIKPVETYFYFETLYLTTA